MRHQAQIRTPPPGDATMLNRPPVHSTRSREHAWPWRRASPRREATSRGSKPMPSSSITRSRPPSSWRKLTKTRLARECFATLFMASCTMRKMATLRRSSTSPSLTSNEVSTAMPR